ncbi:MAG: hypothetical protein V1756_01635 [Patescibacteria group bacterium]
MISAFGKKGVVTIYLIVFGGIFLILFSGLSVFILTQLRQSAEREAWNEALNIAEAGINYYRWCINNNVEEDCLAEKDYYDPSGNLAGGFSLQASSTVSCGQDIKKDIISTGWTDKFPEVKRKISVLYARASVAEFSYILDASVWIGADHEIRGPYHSNGGIRMDGENQSLITSALPEWNCTSTFGCATCPTGDGCYLQGQNCMCPGVFTTTLNGNPGLFSFPVLPFNFVGITIDLGLMKTAATTSGVYLFPSTDIDPQGDGYHIKFKNNGTFEAWIITDLASTSAYSLEEGDHEDFFTITNEYLYNTYTIPTACSVIFIEDNIWPEGEIKGKVTVASANLIDTNQDTDIVLTNDINYTTLDGTDGLALIGERNILIGPQSLDKLELRGIFVAQNGRFGRNHYPNNFRDKLEIYGSIVSKGRVGTQWVAGGHIISGYTQRESYFDMNLIYNPPSFVPHVDPDFMIIDWNEIK